MQNTRPLHAFKLSSFLLNALVNLVKRRICIRMVKFCRSMCEVDINAALGFPVTGIGNAW